jgi:hypothetical protein
MKLLFFKTALALVIILLHISTLTGQKSRLHGRIMEGDTRRPVQFAHVQNVSSRQSVFSDTSGFFHIPAKAGDTLVFSAIGYYYSMTVVSDSLLNTAFFGKYKMTPRIYEIEEARVYAFGTYAQFKHSFISLDLSKNKDEILRRNLQQESLTAAREADRIEQEKRSLEGGGVNLLSIPILTPEEKQMLKLKEIMAIESQKNRVYKKYNPDIIKKVTGIINDDEVLAFMAFCSFSDDYILNVSEYDMMVMIARKYEEFRRLKEIMDPDKNSQMPFNFMESTLNKSC